MQNTWLIKHRKRIDELLIELVELNYRGSNVEVPLKEIHDMIDGSLKEILRLQSLVTQLTIEFQQLKKVVEKPEPPSDRLLGEDEQPKESLDPEKEVMK